MTPEEAIRILEQMRVKHWDDFSNKELHASSLGVEALKRIVNIRRVGNTIPGSLLPGEMKD